MAVIRVFVDKFGNAKILDVHGAEKHCVDITKDLENLIGQTNEATRQLTDNYYEEPLELQNEQEQENG